ncbi:hypothetical protein [Chryseobacterium taeanense]|uniref:hypothetical protein n=1 Tax=Chryseobacterium taeanense TaxID=311334 RepID=UPI0035B08724
MKKHSLLLILFVLFHIQCISQHKTKSNKNIAIINKKMQEIYKIELKEQTRGMSRIVTFEPDSLTVSLNDKLEKLPFSVSDWQNILKQVSLLDLSKISSYQAPTDNRFSDRALSSSIIIFSKGKMYESSTFDAGIPPKELEGLYHLLKGKGGMLKNTKPEFR